MRLTIRLEPASGFALLDGQFPRYFHAAIYNSLGRELADRVHAEGYKDGSRSLKMFVFSDVLTERRPKPEGKGLRFDGPASVVVASPVHEIVDSLATSLLHANQIRIGRELFNILSIHAEDSAVDGDSIDVHSLSPIVTYSTLLRPEGGKYTCYYQPGEREFQRLVAANMARKYRVLHGRDPARGVEVEVLRLGRMVIREFKETVIKGWHCQLRLHGEKNLLKLALDAGLGSKNPQGWGCVGLTSRTDLVLDESASQ
jgi:CRISPR-associated endoribonuclease Cas6